MVHGELKGPTAAHFDLTADFRIIFDRFSLTQTIANPIHPVTTAHRQPDIQAIVFDFGKVICTFDLQHLVRNLARASGVAPATIQTHLSAVGRLAVRYESGRLTSDAFFSEVRVLTGIQISRDDFREAYCDIFSPISTTFELIRSLKPRYKLGLVSNTSEWHFEYGIKPVEIFPLFDTVTLSFQVGAMKPAAAVYEDALRKLGLPASMCIYIDDILDNVDAARGMGFYAIHYTTHDALVASLRAYGVVVS